MLQFKQSAMLSSSYYVLHRQCCISTGGAASQACFQRARGTLSAGSGAAGTSKSRQIVQIKHSTRAPFQLCIGLANSSVMSSVARVTPSALLLYVPASPEIVCMPAPHCMGNSTLHSQYLFPCGRTSLGIAAGAVHGGERPQQETSAAAAGTAVEYQQSSTSQVGLLQSKEAILVVCDASGVNSGLIVGSKELQHASAQAAVLGLSVLSWLLAQEQRTRATKSR